MKTYKLTFITNARYEYTSEIFHSESSRPGEVFSEFAKKYGVAGSGMAFPASFPKQRFVFIPTPAISSIEIVEIVNA